MNRDCMVGGWKQATGKVKEHWGRLIDDQFVVIDGKRDQFSGRAQVGRGFARESAKRQHRAWEARYEELFRGLPNSHGRQTTRVP